VIILVSSEAVSELGGLSSIREVSSVQSITRTDKFLNQLHIVSEGLVLYDDEYKQARVDFKVEEYRTFPTTGAWIIPGYLY
jgi:hypothetical protein